MGQNRFRPAGFIFIAAVFIQGCSPANLSTGSPSSSSSSQSSQGWHTGGSSCALDGKWSVSTQRVSHTGTCQPDNCGWGLNPTCSDVTYAEVATNSGGQIEIRLYFPFIPGGRYIPYNDPFVGTIDSNGDFTATYDDLNGNGAFGNSTLTGTFSTSTCTMSADFHWDPDTNCTAEIQIAGE